MKRQIRYLRSVFAPLFHVYIACAMSATKKCCVYGGTEQRMRTACHIKRFHIIFYVAW